MTGSSADVAPLGTLSLPAPHQTIRINNNAELASAASSGSGTANDPYVIEGYDIAGENGICIYIGNTTQHVIVRDCYLHDQNFVSEPYQLGAGVALYNVQNATVEDNSFTSLHMGVNLDTSSSNTMRNNPFNDCGWGVRLIESNSNIIENNQIDGGSYGVCIETGNNNRISNNTIDGNVMGIFGADANSNSIVNNTITNCILQGIYLQWCAGNMIYGNILMGNYGATSTYSTDCIQANDTGGNFWNSTTYGNYWGDKYSPDTNHDGIVDSGYSISSGPSTDNYPLANVSLVIASPTSTVHTSSSSILVSGSAIDGRGISAIKWHNALSGASGVCPGTSSWSGSVPLVDGTNVITITMVDTDGRKTSGSVTVVRDGTPPSIVISSPIDGSYHTTNAMTASWTVEDANTIVSTEVSNDGSTWVAAAGTSYALSYPNDGEYSFYVRATDNYGNTGTASVSFYIDTTAPTITIDSPTSGEYVNAPTVTWNGFDATSGIDHYEVTLDGTPSFDVTASSHSFTGLSDGPHTVVVKCYDMLGYSGEDSVTFNLDTAAPTFSILSPAAVSYSAGSVTITWSGSDANGIEGYLVRLDSESPISRPSDSSTYAFTGLTDGTHTINVTAVDNAGNVAYDEVVVGVSVDGPVITSNPSSPIYTSDSMIGPLVSMHDTVPMTTANISWYANGVLMEHYEIFGMDGQTSFAFYAAWYPEQGVNIYYVTVNDTVGNSNTAAITVYRDTTPPTVHITSPTNGAFNNTGTMPLTWTATDSIGLERFEIFVNGQKVATLGADARSYTLTLGEGHDEIDVYAYDLAGNSAHSTVNVIVDLTGPIVEITSPTNGSYNITGSVTVRWQGANPLSGIAHYLVSLDDGDEITVSSGTLSYTFSSLDDGEHTVTVTAVDRAGNVETDSVEFIVDTVIPTVSVSPTGTGVDIHTAITIVFSEPMNLASVEIVVSNDVEGSVVFSGNTATYTPSSLLENGTKYYVSVTGRDIAGNTLNAVSNFTTTVVVGNIEGTIVDSSGKPIANATVTLSNGLSVSTNETGWFSFTDVAQGSYSLTVQKAGYEGITVSVTVSPGQTSEVGTKTVQATPQAGGDNTVIIVIVVLAVVVVAALGFVMMRRSREP